MPLYNCKRCEFSTFRPCDIERHVKTKKHLQKMQELLGYGLKLDFTYEKDPEPKKTICEACGNTYSCYKSLWRHKKICKMINHDEVVENKQKNDDKNIIKKLYVVPNKNVPAKKQNKNKVVESDSDSDSDSDESNNDSSSDDESKYTKKKPVVSAIKKKKCKSIEQQEIEDLREQNKKLLELAAQHSQANVINAKTNNLNAKNTNKSLSMMSYAMKHFPNAPEMKLLEGPEAIKLLTYENKGKYSIEDIILFHFSAGTLNKFLGNVLIREFKKKAPEDQSLWSTDTSRLGFILKQIVSGSGSNRWVADKSGIELTKLIITPLLKKVREMMNEYIATILTDVNNDRKNDIYDPEKSSRVFEQMQEANMLISEIMKSDLDKDILKYISPYFGFDDNK